MLTVEGIKTSVERGVRGFESFFEQFDVFEVKLDRWTTGVPFIKLSIEIFVPPMRDIVDGEKGPRLENAISAALALRYPDVHFEWHGGWSGGNPRGWDMWHSLQLGADEQAQRLVFDEEFLLFRYERRQTNTTSRP